MNTQKPIQDVVMERIRKGGVLMRPRWQFVLLGVLWAAGALLTLVLALYLVSLFVFLLRESGLLFVPAFGMRGWFDILRSAPFYIIGLIAICALIINLLARHFAFAYRRPLTVSLGAVLLVTFAGGLLVGATPLHTELRRSAEHGYLPSPFDVPYRHDMRPPPPDDFHKGIVILRDGSLLYLRNADGGTTTVRISPRTRLPFGADLEPGDAVVVIGDETSGAIEAFGLREIDSEPER